MLTAALLLLLAGAALGHFAIMLASHNWWYGQAMPRRVSATIHAMHGVVLFGALVLFWLVYGFAILAPFETGQWLVAGYVAVCWVVGFVVAPAITWRRHRRRVPSLVRSVQSKVVNIAKELGGPPAPPGISSWPAYLPGNQVFEVEFAERTLALPRLPAAWDGLTILHLSDLHFCGVPDKSFFRKVMQLAAEPVPDIVCLTGDFVDSVFYHRWVIPTLGWLRWQVGAFAVMGNHDYWFEPKLLQRRLTRLKVNYLGNSWRQIDVRGEPMVVIGTEWPWAKPQPDLSACPSGPFRLCLSHTPDALPWARRAGVDLMLAGHLHGGQIRFPIVGSVLVPSRYGRRYDCGTFHEAPTTLHVSRGLGGEHPLRWGCRPEVTRFVLRRGE